MKNLFFSTDTEYSGFYCGASQKKTPSLTWTFMAQNEFLVNLSQHPRNYFCMLKTVENIIHFNQLNCVNHDLSLLNVMRIFLSPLKITTHIWEKFGTPIFHLHFSPFFPSLSKKKLKIIKKK